MHRRTDLLICSLIVGTILSPASLVLWCHLWDSEWSYRCGREWKLGWPSCQTGCRCESAASRVRIGAVWAVKESGGHSLDHLRPWHEFIVTDGRCIDNLTHSLPLRVRSKLVLWRSEILHALPGSKPAWWFFCLLGQPPMPHYVSQSDVVTPQRLRPPRRNWLAPPKNESIFLMN